MKTTLQVKQKKHHLGNDIVTIFRLLFANLFSDPYVRILMFNGSGRLVKKKKTTVKVRQHKEISIRSFILISVPTFSYLSILILSTNSILIFVLILTREDKLLKLEILVANNANIRVFVYIFILNFFCKGQHPGACFQ